MPERAKKGSNSELISAEIKTQKNGTIFTTEKKKEKKLMALKSVVELSNMVASFCTKCWSV